MNRQEYREKLKKDKEYLAAKEELKYLLDLADDVLELRLEKGWSQAELAQRAGTKQANISKLESGTGNPTAKFLKKVGDAFGVELNIRLKQQEIEYIRLMPILVNREDSPWDRKRKDPTQREKMSRRRFSLVR